MLGGVVYGPCVSYAPWSRMHRCMNTVYILPGEKVLYDAFPLSNMTSVALYMTPVLNHLGMENITTLYILRSYLSINCFKKNTRV